MLDNDLFGFLLYQNDLLLLFVCTMTMLNYEPGRIADTRIMSLFQVNPYHKSQMM